MPTLDYPHITHAADDVVRLERHPRIRIAQIAADQIGNGWSAEEIVRQYPHLTATEVHAALGYYYDHRPEIDAELATEITALDAADEQAPSALRLRLLSPPSLPSAPPAQIGTKWTPSSPESPPCRRCRAKSGSQSENGRPRHYSHYL